MSDSERDLKVKYRIQRAEETLAEVPVLIENNFASTTVSRLYYACFYAVSALLIHHNISAKTHAGTRRMFGQHFITTGKIEKSLGKFYTDIFDQRHEGDYIDFMDFDIEEIENLVEPAKQLVATIKTLLDKD